MNRNSVSVRAYLANGDLHEVLEGADPKTAIEDYFMPDTPAPVRELILKVRTQDGQLVSLYISANRIEAAVLGFSERHKSQPQLS
jgi:hypothetical protein